MSGKEYNYPDLCCFVNIPCSMNDPDIILLPGLLNLLKFGDHV